MSRLAGSGSTTLRAVTLSSTLPAYIDHQIANTVELVMAWIWRALVLIGLAATAVNVGSMPVHAQLNIDVPAILHARSDEVIE
jgi:hypothetical protein